MALRRRRWTQFEKRWLKRHREDGLAIVSELLDRSRADVLSMADELGIDVAAIPEEGAVCPWCGRRMSTSGTGYRLAGICEACWIDYRRMCREAMDAEVAARRADAASRQRASRDARRGRG